MEAFKAGDRRQTVFELSYLPSEGFRVTDCAALSNGDVIVLERRYVPFGSYPRT